MAAMNVGMFLKKRGLIRNFEIEGSGVLSIYRLDGSRQSVLVPSDYIISEIVIETARLSGIDIVIRDVWAKVTDEAVSLAEKNNVNIISFGQFVDGLQESSL